MGTLSNYLKRAGVTTGPLSSKENTSHSGCNATLRALWGLPPLPPFSAHNTYGNATHEQFLEGKKSYKISKDEQRMVHAAIKALNRHPLVKRLMSGSTREQKLYKKIRGVLVAYILDINNKKQRCGADLKTTSCKTINQFIKSMVEYGYFRQAVLYIWAEGLKMFFFIAVTKTHTPQVFIVAVNNFKEEMKNAEFEVEFLLYFAKYYGKMVPKTKWIENE